MRVPPLGQAPLVIERPRAIATDERLDAIFAAKSALRRAYALRAASDVQIDQLKLLVSKLEAEQRG